MKPTGRNQRPRKRRLFEIEFTGYIKNYNQEKGFGFIIPDLSDKLESLSNIFFHITEVTKNMEKDDFEQLIHDGNDVKIRFTPGKNDKGSIATNIHVINTES